MTAHFLAMLFTAQGYDFDQFVNEHIHPLPDELMSIGKDIDKAIEEGEYPPQEAIDAMFYVVDKMRAQARYISQIADGLEQMLKNILDEGTGALSTEEENKEEEDEITEELTDLAKHSRDVITTLDANGIDKEIIANVTEFAEYIEMLV